MQEKLANLDEAPPPLALLELVTGHYISRALYVAAKLGIADLLHEGPQHSAKLAEATGTDAPTLHRVLLLLASAGVFTHTADGAAQVPALAPVGSGQRGFLGSGLVNVM